MDVRSRGASPFLAAPAADDAEGAVDVGGGDVEVDGRDGGGGDQQRENENNARHRRWAGTGRRLWLSDAGRFEATPAHGVT